MPEFYLGEQKTAVVVMSNPTAKAFDYVVELYMGEALALKAQASFHLEAAESKNVSLVVTMPSAVGSYPVYLAVFSGGVFIPPLYQGENITVVAAPAFTFSSGSVSTKTCPTASAWWTPVIDYIISNPDPRSVTRSLTLWRQEYSHTYNRWYSPQPITRMPWSGMPSPCKLTLAPGASYAYHYDGYFQDTVGDWLCDPLIAMRYTVRYWLQDELGNQSPYVEVVRP